MLNNLPVLWEKKWQFNIKSYSYKQTDFCFLSSKLLTHDENKITNSKLVKMVALDIQMKGLIASKGDNG